jgi:hypothetical protein
MKNANKSKKTMNIPQNSQKSKSILNNNNNKNNKDSKRPSTFKESIRKTESSLSNQTYMTQESIKLSSINENNNNNTNNINDQLKDPYFQETENQKNEINNNNNPEDISRRTSKSPTKKQHTLNLAPKDSTESNTTQIKVVARFRPLNAVETVKIIK